MERRSPGEVHPVGCEVLRHQDQLAHAGRSESLRLDGEVLNRSAILHPAKRWDDAERTFVRAALGDLEVRRVPRHRVDAWDGGGRHEVGVGDDPPRHVAGSLEHLRDFGVLGGP